MQLISLRIFTQFGLFLVCLTGLKAQEISFTEINSNTNASFRAMSVVNDLVIWVSGNNGWYGRSKDGGENWEFDQHVLFKEYDFRSLYAFDYNNAIMVSAGSPAYILRTMDGGQTWIPVYQNSHPDIFLDGMDFWNEREGVIYGDPIDGKMVVLITRNGGYSWDLLKEESRPDMEDGEASFAASGTGIRCFDHAKILVSSGGRKSRLFYSEDQGNSWSVIDVPIVQGNASEGIYSLAVDGNKIVVVGGDYTREESRTNNAFYSKNEGKRWTRSIKNPGGYRECVEYLSESMLITTGPNGTDISRDGGVTWNEIQDAKGMHVVRKSREGNLVVMAGRNGIIYLVR